MVKTVFIVEDDPDISEIMQMVIEKDGYKTIRFFKVDGVEMHALSKKPSLIVMDLFVDGVDGTEVVRKLKKNKKTSSIPVILVSAKTSLEDTAKKSKVEGYLEKPFNIKDLTALVKKLVK